MKSYSDRSAAIHDALRLATSMTYKFALAGIPMGGAKTVIDVPFDLGPKSRHTLLRDYGALVRNLGGLFYTGPDVGTSTDDMDVIAETGAPYVLGRTLAAGGAGDSGPMTARGVLAGIDVVCNYLYGNRSTRGRRVLVQGAGNVGRALIGYLCTAGYEVLFSDVDERVVGDLRNNSRFAFVPCDFVYDTECDIFAPCALGGVLNSKTIPRLKCRAVIGGANDQLGSQEDAERLRARGILYAPDHVVNVGGAMGVTGVELFGWSRARVETEIVERIQRSLRQVIRMAVSEGITTDAAARRIIEERLAMPHHQAQVQRTPF